MLALWRHQARVPTGFMSGEKVGVKQQHKTCQPQGCSQLFTFITSAPKSMLPSTFWHHWLCSLTSNLWLHFWGSWWLSWLWTNSSDHGTFSRKSDRYNKINLVGNIISPMFSRRTFLSHQYQKSQNHESWPQSHETEEKKSTDMGDLGVCFSAVNFPYLLSHPLPCMTCI